MLDYGISIALVASALDEVAQNRNLIKMSAAEDDDERDLFEYLNDNLEDCQKRSAELAEDWFSGVQKFAYDHRCEGLVKEALLGIDMHPALDIPLTIGAYMTPVLGTGLMTADAARNFYKMFGKDLSWKQRLGHGLMGLLDATFAGISLFPGAGAVGGVAKTGKIGKILSRLGKPGAKALKAIDKTIDISRAGATAARRASKAKGVKGGVMRALGFGPAYKAGRIRNWMRSLVGKAPKTYLNPYQRMGQWQRQLSQIRRLNPQQLSALRAGEAVPGVKGLLGLQEAAGGAAQTSPFWASMAVDNPAWRRVILGMTPATVASSALAGAGPGPSYATEEVMRRLPPEVARHGKRIVPLIQRPRRRLRY
jgi:hypothetical protein